MNLTHIFHALVNILNEMSPYILLGFLIAGLLHAFVRPETMSRHLSGNGIKPVLKAALFGIPLPLCSCGVLPTAVGLRRQGASEGATTAFLISTPQTGVDSIAATYALLGLPFAIIRPIAALVGALAGGVAVDRCNKHPESLNTTRQPLQSTENTAQHSSFFAKLLIALRYGLVDMVGSVGKWLVIGLIIAAIITVSVPDTFFLSLRQYPLLAMIAMVIVAVPMYICATGSIPIAMSLMLKGLSPGVAFVMLMAGPAANFASVMVLRRTLGNHPTAIYVGSVVATALIFGLIIDYLLPAQWFVTTASSIIPTENCHIHFSWFSSACSILLVVLLAYTAFLQMQNSRRFHHHSECELHNHENNISNNTIMNTTIYEVKGMACNHCKTTVEKVVSAIEGVQSVAVELTAGKVAVTGTATEEEISKAITDAGFDFLGKSPA